MVTINDWIAVTPFPSVNIKTSHTRGVALMDQTQKLTELTVLADAYSADGKHLFRPNNKLYVKGDAMKHQWAGEVLTMDDGTKYILIPKSIVVAVNTTE